MKLFAVTVFLAFFSTFGSGNQLTLNGKAYIRFYGPKEEIWNGLSDAYRFPFINSGDMIALRSAYPSGSYSKYWLYCHTSHCQFVTCPGTVMTKSHWSSCSKHMRFRIFVMGKMDGQPINSVYCLHSIWVWTTSSMKGNNWLTYYYAAFQIFSRNGVDGTPVQYGDIVGFKYVYGGYNTWLRRYSSRFYSRSCSPTNKLSCAAKNTVTGFKIFKKL